MTISNTAFMPEINFPDSSILGFLTDSVAAPILEKSCLIFNKIVGVAEKILGKPWDTGIGL